MFANCPHRAHKGLVCYHSLHIMGRNFVDVTSEKSRIRFTDGIPRGKDADGGGGGGGGIPLCGLYGDGNKF